jgi:hypothetical protein
MMRHTHHHDVRTTLTIDDDLAPKIDAEMRRTGRSFKETVNHLLRLGLAARRDLKRRSPFEVHARPLGARRGLDFDNVAELLEQLEGPTHR